MARKQLRPEWAIILAAALDKWCPENGYTPKNALADELEIPRGEWSTISAGDSIVSNVASYAKVFRKTGLWEADPRSIPPRRMHIPKTGEFMEKSRAWTEEEWQEWLKNSASQSERPQAATQTAPARVRILRRSLPKAPAPTDTPTTPKPEQPASVPSIQTPSSGGSIFDAMLASVAQQAAEVALARNSGGSGANSFNPNEFGSLIADEIIGRLQAALTLPDERMEQAVERALRKQGSTTPKDGGSSKTTIKSLIADLYHALKPVMAEDAPSSERDKVVAESREYIGRLYALLDLLTQPQAKRESSLKLPREV